MKSIIFKKMSHLNKIVLLYNDGQNVYIVGINDDNDNISNSCSCLMRSININLNIFFRLRGQIPMETVGNACKDIYILYKCISLDIYYIFTLFKFIFKLVLFI